MEDSRQKGMDEARAEARRCLDALRAIGYEPEAVRASGGDWDGVQPLVSELTSMRVGGEAATFGTLLTLADCDGVEDLRGVRAAVGAVEDRGAVVYAVQVCQAFGGLCVTCLCVDVERPDTWEAEREGIAGGLGTFAAVVSPATDGEPEFGQVGIEARGGGLVRTW